MVVGELGEVKKEREEAIAKPESQQITLVEEFVGIS